MDRLLKIERSPLVQEFLVVGRALVALCRAAHMSTCYFRVDYEAKHEIFC